MQAVDAAIRPEVDDHQFSGEFLDRERAWRVKPLDPFGKGRSVYFARIFAGQSNPFEKLCV